MKKITLLLAFAIVFLGASAQKIKLKKGNMDFLKGQDELSLTFVYPDDMKVGKLTEKQYVTGKMQDAEEDEAGGGERWKQMWLADRDDHYQPKFAELFNEILKKKKVDLFADETLSPEYGMIVTTTFIEPGYNIGISRKNASINLVVTFVKNDDPDNVLAEFTILKAPGRSMGYGDYDSGARVGEAYAKAGKDFAAFLVKQKMVK